MVNPNFLCCVGCWTCTTLPCVVLGELCLMLRYIVLVLGELFVMMLYAVLCWVTCVSRKDTQCYSVLCCVGWAVAGKNTLRYATIRCVGWAVSREDTLRYATIRCAGLGAMLCTARWPCSRLCPVCSYCLCVFTGVCWFGKQNRFLKGQ